MSQNVWATIMPFGPVTNFLLAPNLFHNTLDCVFYFTLLPVIKLIKDHWQDQDI